MSSNCPSGDRAQLIARVPAVGVRAVAGHVADEVVADVAVAPLGELVVGVVRRYDFWVRLSAILFERRILKGPRPGGVFQVSSHDDGV